MKQSFVRFAVAAVMLVCVNASVLASSPVTKGGVVKSMDLEGLSFGLSGAITLGYDYQGLPGKPGDIRIKYKPHTVFLLDGVPTSPEQALKPGNVHKRSWVKHGGSVELFSANSPMLDSRNATISLCGMFDEGDISDKFLALRMECKDGKFAQVYCVMFKGWATGI